MKILTQMYKAYNLSPMDVYLTQLIFSLSVSIVFKFKRDTIKYSKNTILFLIKLFKTTKVTNKYLEQQEKLI